MTVGVHLFDTEQAGIVQGLKNLDETIAEAEKQRGWLERRHPRWRLFGGQDLRAHEWR